MKGLEIPLLYHLLVEGCEMSATSKFVTCGECKFYRVDRIKWGITSGFCGAKWFENTGPVPKAFSWPISDRMYEKEKIVCRAFIPDKPSQTTEANE